MNRPFVFGPLERRGVFLGVRLGQLVVGVAATGLIVALLAISPTPAGALVAVVVMLGAGTIAVVPVAGRTVEEWLPVAAGYAVNCLLTRHHWIADDNLRGHRLTAAPWTGHEVRDPQPQSGPSAKRRRHRDAATPGTRADDRLVGAVCRLDAGDAPAPYLQGIELLAARWRQGDVGVVKDARRRTYVGVVAARGRGFAVLDPGDRDRLLAQWGEVLAGLAREGGPVARIQWLERTVPDDSEGVVRHLQDTGTAPTTNPFVSSYLSLLEEAGAQTQQHEVLLALQVSAWRAASTIRHLGAGPDLGACEVLSRELIALARALREAEVDVRGVLSPRMLAAALRHAVDPPAREHLAHRSAANPEIAGASARNALPRRSVTTWSSLRTEAAHHATYWISEWPRTPVGADWMGPLLLGTRTRRSVSVVMEPCAPAVALRRVEAARVDDETTQSFRERMGFRRTVRKRREEENVARAEEELNEGHQAIRLSAYITVTARTAPDLDESCTDLEQHARRCGLDVRREYGTQDVAFTYTLPLCRGLR